MDKAAKYGKRVGFRVMLNNPDIVDEALQILYWRRYKCIGLRENGKEIRRCHAFSMIICNRTMITLIF